MFFSDAIGLNVLHRLSSDDGTIIDSFKNYLPSEKLSRIMNTSEGFEHVHTQSPY